MHKILEFIWPMMAASAEAMIFLWIIVILVVIGRGKLLPSEKHIVIERNGQYKMDLAAGLNLAQPFIEALAKQISGHREIVGHDSEFRFMVRDKNIVSRKQPFYILGISMKNGHLCFEARTAPSTLSPPTTLRFVPDNSHSLMNHVEREIYTVAKLWEIDVDKIVVG